MSVSRRTLLAGSGASAAAGLVLALKVHHDSGTDAPIPKRPGALVRDVLLQVTPDGTVHFHMPSNEVGQGVWTGLTTLVAEELSTPPDRIAVSHATVHPDYINPKSPVPGLQLTASSASMRGFYPVIRQFAANLRETLRTAASRQLGVSPDALTVRDGRIWLDGTGHSFGDFVDTARTVPPVTNAPLKPEDQLQYIGQHGRRIDARSKVDGTARYGLDMDLPGMVKLVVRRCPVYGGGPRSFNADAVLAMPGVEAVVPLQHGVGVVARSIWQAHAALKVLEVEWDLPALATRDSAAIFAELTAALDQEEGKSVVARGAVDTAMATAEHTLVADFQTPYLAHATMEPMTCAVHIDGDTCHIWDGTQSNTMTRDAAARTLGWPRQQIQLHPLFAGGGFGRRPYNDYVVETIEVAMLVGKPVHLVWSREHDLQHDYYRPASAVRLAAGMAPDGTITAWTADRAGPNLLPYVMDEMIDFLSAGRLPLAVADWLSKRNYDVFAAFPIDPYGVEGLFEEYDFPALAVRERTVDAGVPVGFWRSVGHSANAFATEVFLDELAAVAGLDPVDLRLRNLRNNPEVAAFLQEAAGLLRWGESAPEGRSRGFAMHRTYGTLVAQVAEVSVEDGTLRLHHVGCVVDCGRAVNPDIVRSQMESGILFGATAALMGEITFKGGAVEQSNFHNYPMLRMHNAPAIEVHILERKTPPTGVGEPGTAPIAPAIANAVRAATGQTVRTLPLSKGFRIA